MKRTNDEILSNIINTLKNSDRPLILQEVSNLSKTDRITCKRMLERLARLGIINKEKKGNSNYYSFKNKEIWINLTNKKTYLSFEEFNKKSNEIIKEYGDDRRAAYSLSELYNDIIITFGCIDVNNRNEILLLLYKLKEFTEDISMQYIIDSCVYDLWDAFDDLLISIRNNISIIDINIIDKLMKLFSGIWHYYVVHSGNDSFNSDVYNELIKQGKYLQKQVDINDSRKISRELKKAIEKMRGD